MTIGTSIFLIFSIAETANSNDPHQWLDPLMVKKF